MNRHRLCIMDQHFTVDGDPDFHLVQRLAGAPACTTPGVIDVEGLGIDQMRFNIPETIRTRITGAGYFPGLVQFSFRGR